MKIGNGQKLIDFVETTYLRPPQDKASSNGHSASRTPSALLDNEVLDLASSASNAGKFSSLFDRGDLSAYSGDDSSADLALVSLLAFYTQDEEQIDRLFRESALYRPEKWGRRQDYRKRTIDKVLSGLTEIYSPPNNYIKTPNSSNNTYNKSSEYGNASGNSLNGTGHRGHRDTGVGERAPEVEAPDFPLESLPERARMFVSEVAREMDVKDDFVAIPVLVSLAQAIGGARKLRITRKWSEGTTLYAALVAPPGTKKSPSMKAAAAPTVKREMKAAEAYERALKEWAKMDGEDDQPDEPRRAQFIVDDTTVEALIPILAENPKGILVYKDELTSWLKSMDQYKGGAGSDKQHYLTLWSMSLIKINRKTGGEVTYAKSPSISLCGGIQPKVLGTIGRSEEEGLIERFLFAFPVTRTSRPTAFEVSEETDDGYTDLINELYKLPLNIGIGDKDDYAQFVKMSPTARELFDIYLNQLADEMDSPAFRGRLRGAYAKFSGYLARLSLILAISNRKDEVGEADVDAAWALIEYFKAHAHKVYDHMEPPTARELLEDHLFELVAEGPVTKSNAEWLEGLEPYGVITSQAVGELFKAPPVGLTAKSTKNNKVRGWRIFLVTDGAAKEESE